ncbi:MAG: zf-HC2 domain-containing protein [Lapillicoccus sp.]
MSTPPGAGRETEREHEQVHLLLGAFVLGGLDAEDHQAFTRHLRHCATCQRESAQLSGLPALLDVVEPERVDAVLTPAGVPDAAGRSQPSVLVPARLLERVRADRRRRGWRLVAAAAVLAVLAGGIGAGVGPLLSRVNAPPTRPLVATAAPAVPDGGTAAAVEIDLVTRTWGTQLDLRGTSLPAGQVLYLSVTDKQGHAYDVASWTGTPTGRATLTAACWMRTADIAQVQVHTRSGTAIATATT